MDSLDNGSSHAQKILVDSGLSLALNMNLLAGVLNLLSDMFALQPYIGTATSAQTSPPGIFFSLGFL
jgi:hypothetical protein